MSEIVEIGAFRVPAAELGNMLITYQMLPNLVREIAIDRGLAAIHCDDAETTEAIKTFYGRLQLKTNEQLQEWLAAQGLTRVQLDKIAVRQHKIEKFKQETWGPKVESYFLNRKGQLDKVIYSLIRTKDIGMAQELYFRLLEGEQSFEDLARRYSEGAEAQTGGLIGPVEISTPHPVIGKLLSSHPTGQICPPIKLDQWFVIVRPDKYIPCQLDDQMRQKLVAEMFQTWLQGEIAQGLATKAEPVPEIPVDDPVLNADLSSVPNSVSDLTINPESASTAS
jgi:parvulin-like peptidyl-prolyl isomerase